MNFTYSTVDMLEDCAYLDHHFDCPMCCAAGSNPATEQQRCTEGLTLWNAYEAASRARDKAERETLATRKKSWAHH